MLRILAIPDAVWHNQPRSVRASERLCTVVVEDDVLDIGRYVGDVSDDNVSGVYMAGANKVTFYSLEDARARGDNLHPALKLALFLCDDGR